MNPQPYGEPSAPPSEEEEQKRIEATKLRKEMDAIVYNKSKTPGEKKQLLKEWVAQRLEGHKLKDSLTEILDKKFDAIRNQKKLAEKPPPPSRDAFKDRDFDREAIKEAKERQVREVPSDPALPAAVWPDLEEQCKKFLADHGCPGAEVVVVPDLTVTGTASTGNKAITLFNEENRQNVLIAFANVLSGEQAKTNFDGLKARIHGGNPICVKHSLAAEGTGSLSLAGNLFHEYGHFSTGDAPETEKVFSVELTNAFAYLGSDREKMNSYWRTVRDYKWYANWVKPGGAIDTLMGQILTPDNLKQWNALMGTTTTTTTSPESSDTPSSDTTTTTT